MSTGYGWFADQDDETGTPGFPWRPYLQDDIGCIPLEVWFATEEDCERYIRENVLGKGLLDG